MASVYSRSRGLLKAMEILVPLGILLAWFLLNRYILPAFGVPT